MKRGQLSNKEKKYIKDNCKTISDLDSIADTLDRSKNIIKKYFDSLLTRKDSVADTVFIKKNGSVSSSDGSLQISDNIKVKNIFPEDNLHTIK